LIPGVDLGSVGVQDGPLLWRSSSCQPRQPRSVLRCLRDITHYERLDLLLQSCNLFVVVTARRSLNGGAAPDHDVAPRAASDSALEMPERQLSLAHRMHRAISNPNPQKRVRHVRSQLPHVASGPTRFRPTSFQPPLSVLASSGHFVLRVHRLEMVTDRRSA
jgi:hypothetical protein